jgi:hypothetical protein
VRLLGHDEHYAALKRHLGPVTILVGPRSVGKWTAAEHLRRFHQIGDSDLLRVNRLTADTARTVVRFASTAPHGESKLAIISLTQASAAAMATLLKTLEDATPTFRAILTSEREPIKTLASRGTIYRFKTLSDEHLIEILSERFGMKGKDAQQAVSKAGGQVKPALDAAKGYEDRVVVIAALRAFSEHDSDALDRLADKWTESASELLAIWCRERITGRWRIFLDTESDLTGKGLPLKILMALNTNNRPRLVVRSSLMSLLRGI